MQSKSFNVQALTEKRAMLQTLKAEIAELVTVVKQEKVFMAEARVYERERKANARAVKQAEQVAKLEARLAKLKNPKRPSKVTIYKDAEAQALAA